MSVDNPRVLQSVLNMPNQRLAYPLLSDVFLSFFVGEDASAACFAARRLVECAWIAVESIAYDQG